MKRRRGEERRPPTIAARRRPRTSDRRAARSSHGARSCLGGHRVARARGPSGVLTLTSCAQVGIAARQLGARRSRSTATGSRSIVHRAARPRATRASTTGRQRARVAGAAAARPARRRAATSASAAGARSRSAASSAGATNGMSPATQTTRVAIVRRGERRVDAASGPTPRAPDRAPPRRPARAHGAGSFATTSTRANAAAQHLELPLGDRSRPPTVSDRFATPPSRVSPRPPAMIAPATVTASPRSWPGRVRAARDALEDAHHLVVDAAVAGEHAPGLAVEGAARRGR